MKNKDLTPLTQGVKCSEQQRKLIEPEQGEDHRAPASVIITPDPEDPAVCLWCQVEPASSEHYPYCSQFCATNSAVDNEVDR